MQITSSHNANWDSLLQGEAPIQQTQFISQLSLDPSFQVSAGSIRTTVEQLHHRLEAKIYQIGPQTQERLAKANERIFQENEKVRSKLMALAMEIKEVREDPSLSAEQRRAKLAKLYEEVAKWRARLKPPIDFIGLTQRLEAIVNDSSLTKKQKKEQIEQLREEAGLTRREMREIFTGRLEKIYHAAREELQALRQESLARLGEQLQAVEAQQGPNSLQAVALRQEIREVDQITTEYQQRLEQNESIYKGLYGGKSCIKRLGGAVGGFFKGVGNILRHPIAILKKAAGSIVTLLKRNWHAIVPRLLNLIPGIGPALAKISTVGISIYRVIKAARSSGQAKYEKVKNWIIAAKDMVKTAVTGLFGSA